MNFLKHRQQSQCQVLLMPNGLQELMSDISREVLRCQPSIDCIYKFIADYLDAMIETREKSQIAMGIIEEVILSTDEVYSQFHKCHIPKDKTSNFVGELEITFRRFVEKKRKMNQDPRYITFQADDMLDELMRKCDLTKIEILRSRPAIQWAYKKFVQTYIAAIEGTFDVADLYENTNKLVISCREFEELEKSAVTIQKTYRGFHVRKRMDQLGKDEPKMIQDKIDDPEQRSAVMIQKHYRGYKVRKTMQDEPKMIQDKIPDPEQKSAVMIQKHYRGYKVRKNIQNVVDIEDSFEKFKNYAKENKDLNNAAIKIQSTYKGFVTRKKMKDL